MIKPEEYKLVYVIEKRSKLLNNSRWKPVFMRLSLADARTAAKHWRGINGNRYEYRVREFVPKETA